MLRHYQNYYWKNGKPYGRDSITPDLASVSYKIVTDPYYKRFSLEKYSGKRLEQVIYDSLLLDFRHLTPMEQTAWQRETLFEDETQTTCLLRNQDDRAILIEKHHFVEGVCRFCTLHSIHGVLLSIHCMYYETLNDPFNGVVLYDVEKRPILMKIYALDPHTGEFTQLLKEDWDMQHPPFNPGTLWLPSTV